MIERYLGPHLPASRFARNVLLLSLAALLPPLTGYVLLRPGVTEMLAQGGAPAARLLMRQIVTGGLPIVFAATWIGLMLHGSRRGGPWRTAIDVPLRLAVFALLHAAIYVLSADWFGSFDGSRMTALRVVPPTLARAAAFENVSGAYLYATLLAALPTQISALRRDLPIGPLPAVVAALVWMAVCVMAFTLTMVAWR